MSNDLAIQSTLPKYLKEFDGVPLGNEGVEASQLAVPRLILVQKSSEIPDAKAGDFVDKVSGTNYGTSFTCINLQFKENFIIMNSFNAGGGIFGPWNTQEEAEQEIPTTIKENKLDEKNVDVWRQHNHLLYIADKNQDLNPLPVVWSIRSSAIKPSRNWNTQITAKGGHRFSYVWTVKSVVQKKDNFSWHNFETDVLRSGETGNPLYTPEKLVENIKEMVLDPNFSF
tara:strand:- start:38 stop:718 length:681 start_codon:yes stop_codon:yes gene_type:complete